VIKFCKNGDKRIAVGTGIRPIEHCRACYIKEHGDEFELWKVVFRDQSPGEREDLAIACAKTGEDIQAGGTVWLDPVETQIAALVYAGFIEPVEPVAVPAPAKAPRAAAS
jgi:hypothetical protein